MEGENINGDSTANEVKITQDKLDKLINEKFGQGAEKGKSALLQELGVASVDDLKATIAKTKELEDAQKSESQKIMEAMEAKNKELEILRGELETTKTKAEISNIANKHGFVDEEYLEFEYKKAKSTDGFELDKWVEALKQSKPYLFKEAQTKPMVKTDMSANNAQGKSITELIKSAKTQKELDAIYAQMNKGK